MALNAAVVWEVRTAGDDTNGGAFKAGASGTDYSQQDAKNTTGNNISTTDAVAAGTTTITSATASFTSAIVGNVIYFQGGTGAIAAVWRECTVFTNSTTITIDASIAVSTGMTMNIGGALLTLQTAATSMVTSNKVFVKIGTYTRTATTTFSAASADTSNTVPPNRLIGYSTTRADNGRPTIALSTNTGLTGLKFTTYGWEIRNFIVDCASLGTSTGIDIGGGLTQLSNCKVSNFTLRGIQGAAAGQNIIFENEVTGGTSAASAAINSTGSGSVIAENYVHDNACPGVIAGGATVIHNLCDTNTGASSDGIRITGGESGGAILNNSVYNSGRDGIRASNNVLFAVSLVWNNILSTNGAYGLTAITTNGIGAMPSFDGNAFFSNTSGTRFAGDDTGSVNAINGVSPYSNVRDVILTADPFTNAAAGDFSLNTTTGGGAACRAAGFPGLFPGGLTTGSLDIGAAQHADPADTDRAAALVNGGLVR